jgi:hypothetical protein
MPTFTMTIIASYTTLMDSIEASVSPGSNALEFAILLYFLKGRQAFMPNGFCEVALLIFFVLPVIRNYFD